MTTQELQRCVADLRLYMGIESTAEENRELEQIAPLALDTLEADRRFTYETNSGIDYLQGTGTDTLWLVNLPSAAPSEVLERTTLSEAGSVITDYVVRGQKLVRTGGVWTSGYEYQVSYASGYTYATMPGHIKLAFWRIAAVIYRLRGKDGTKNEAISGYSYTKYDEIREILDQIEARQVFS